CTPAAEFRSMEQFTKVSVGGPMPDPSRSRFSPAGRSEASRSSARIAQFPFLPLHGFITRDNHLGDPVAAMHDIMILAEVEQDDADLAAITRVDGRRAIGQRDGVIECQSAARADLRLAAR